MATTADSESSRLPAQGHTPTALGILISGAKNTEQEVEILKWMTLNELHGVHAADAIGVKQGVSFKLGWFGVGLKGSRAIGENDQGIEVRRINEHRATDNAPFLGTPLLVRELANDISEEKRKNYRMRVVKKIGSKTYVMYFLRAIKFDMYKPTVKLGYRDPVTGNNKEDAYTPVESDLHPKPYVLLSTDSIPATDQYSTATGTMNLTLEAEELDELRNACAIVYGDASVAAINEIYLVHGIDMPVNDGVGPNGTAVRYNELVPACVSYQVTENYARDANTNNRMKLYFEYGNSVAYLTELKSTDNATLTGNS